MLLVYQRYHTLFNLLLVALIGVALGLLAASLLEATLGVRPTTNRVTTVQDQTETHSITQTDLDQILQGNIFDPAGRRAWVRRPALPNCQLGVNRDPGVFPGRGVVLWCRCILTTGG